MNNFQLGTIVGWVKAAGRNPSKPKRWVTTENHIEAYNFNSIQEGIQTVERLSMRHQVDIARE